jgi:hypothetical protein
MLKLTFHTLVHNLDIMLFTSILRTYAHSGIVKFEFTLISRKITLTLNSSKTITYNLHQHRYKYYFDYFIPYSPTPERYSGSQHRIPLPNKFL